MTEESKTDVLDKYVKLKEEYEALKIQIGALEKTNGELTTAYEKAKGEIGSLQGLVTKYVVSSEPDNPPSKPQTLKELFKCELDKNRK